MHTHLLSKSTYMRGLKCHKSLYLNKYHNELKDELSARQEAIFAQGTDVGLLAQQLFPGGVDVSPESYFDFSRSLADTKEAMAKGETVIYEAAFLFDEVLCAIDILVKDEEGWKAYEVKSSTSVSETYIEDTALQYYVITHAGVPLVDMSVIHINNQYVKKGALDIRQLFTSVSVLDEVKPIQANIPMIITDMKNTLRQDNIPSIDIGLQCTHPYDCDFMGYCWKHIPAYSVFDISGLLQTKKFELYDMGVVTLEQIPKDYALNDNQWMQVHCELEQKSHIDKAKIRAFLNNLNYPLYFLDFETMATAVPVFDNTRPYQQFVFQYSLHVQEKLGGELKHYEYLAQADGTDPRTGFIDQIIKDCGTSGDVVVYNAGFEKGKLNDLTEVFPQHEKQVRAIIDRIVDLMTPFRKRWYYLPEMRGSYSIKKVLPALVPELSYSDLEISEGGTASNAFTEMVMGTFDGDIQKTRKDLLEYCKLDTYAMVRILEKLYTV